jgi:aminopeptidase N
MYRDSRYTADMTAASTKRINDVIGLRNSQFLEDAGGTAHPIRPETYISMSNFYTSTVYSKGQEICRMYEMFLGLDGFRKGMDLYFKRHDGNAVTCDDFRAAMADANGITDGLAQFEEWYLQAGTPTVKSELSYDSASGQATLRLVQSCPATPGQPVKRPFLMPVMAGLLDGETGVEILPTTLLELSQSEQDFVFDLGPGLTKPPVLSVFRGFSAPVISEVIGQTVDDLAFLMEYDTDSFCRWDASQELAIRAVLTLLGAISPASNSSNPAEAFIAAALASLEKVADPETDEDLGLIAYTLTLPSENVLCEAVKAAGIAVDPVVVHEAREQLKNTIASVSVEALQQVYRAHRTDYAQPFELTTRAVGARRLCALVLQYLCATEQAAATAEICAEQLKTANNMTDELSALTCLVAMDCPQRQPAIDAFEAKWSQDELVMQSWFSVQAVCPLEGTLARVRELMKHPMWTSTNTNFVRAVRSFANSE